MTKDTQSEEQNKEPESYSNFKATLRVMAVVGVAAGLYGYRLGRRSGLSQGLTIGYISAGEQLIKAWRDHTQEMRIARGEESQ